MSASGSGRRPGEGACWEEGRRQPVNLWHFFSLLVPLFSFVIQRKATHTHTHTHTHARTHARTSKVHTLIRTQHNTAPTQQTTSPSALSFQPPRHGRSRRAQGKAAQRAGCARCAAPAQKGRLPQPREKEQERGNERAVCCCRSNPPQLFVSPSSPSLCLHPPQALRKALDTADEQRSKEDAELLRTHAEQVAQVSPPSPRQPRKAQAPAPPSRLSRRTAATANATDDACKAPLQRIAGAPGGGAL